MPRRSNAQNHIHKYKKFNLTRNKDKEPYYVYQCVLPLCSHYTPVNLSVGKMSLCNRCNEPFIITKETLQGYANRATVRPHCIDCTDKRKENPGLTTISDFLGSK